MPDYGAWLKRLIKGGISLIPLVGGLLTEGADAWFGHLDKKPDAAAIKLQLDRVASHAKETDTLLDALVDALAAGDVDAPFIEPIEDLRDALAKPDEPPARVRTVLDRLQERLGSFDAFQAECRDRFEALERDVADLKARPPADVERIDETIVHRTITRPVPAPTAANAFVSASGRISNLPNANPDFAGRDGPLRELEAALAAGPAALTQAVHGLGGVGKTQLAVEYARRHPEDYDIIWWVRSEVAHELLSEFAALARPMNLPCKDAADLPAVAAAVRQELRRRDRWLLIFDNAPDADAVRHYLPGGSGHVLITSRWADWGGLASPLKVLCFPRAESIQYLRKRGVGNDAERNALADALGDLPLALTLAASYILSAGRGPAEYLDLLRRSGAKLLAGQTPPEGYAFTVATTWDVSIRAVLAESRPAGDLLQLLAFFAPENIPRNMIVDARERLPRRLAAAAGDEMRFDACVSALRRYSLIDAAGDVLSVHRLLQAIVRDGLRRDTSRRRLHQAMNVVNKSFPFNSDDVATWPVAEVRFPHAQAVIDHAREMEIPQRQLGRLLNQCGLYLRGRADFAAARKHLEHALRIYEAALGPKHPDVVTCLSNLGLVLESLGSFSEAKACHERALRMGEAALGPDHQSIAIRFNNLGSVLESLGDLSEAKACYERALQIVEAALGPDHPNVATCANNLGSVLNSLGDLSEAKAYCERALRIDEAALGPDHPKVATEVNNLGSVWKSLGDPSKAKACYERALRIDEAVLGPDHPAVATDVNNLGGVLQSLGNLSDAKACYERSMVILEDRLGPDHPDTVTVRENLELLRRRLGEGEGLGDAG